MTFLGFILSLFLPLSFSLSFSFSPPVPFLFSSLSPSVPFSLDDLCDSAPLCGFEKLFNATSSKLCNVRSERKLDDYAKRVRFFCLPLDNGSFSPRLFCAKFVAFRNSRPVCDFLPRALVLPRFSLPFPYCLALHTQPAATTRSGVQRDSIFTEFSYMDPFRLVRSHFIPLTSSRRNFPVIVVRHAHNVYPRYHTFLFHSGQYVPLPAALCSTRDSCHDRSRRIHSGNSFETFFIYLQPLFTILSNSRVDV